MFYRRFLCRPPASAVSASAAASGFCRFGGRCRFWFLPLRWPLPSPAFSAPVAAAAFGFCRFGGRCRFRLLPFRWPLPLSAFSAPVAAAVSGFCRGARPPRPCPTPFHSVRPARKTCTARTAKAETPCPSLRPSGWFRLAEGPGGFLLPERRPTPQPAQRAAETPGRIVEAWFIPFRETPKRFTKRNESGRSFPPLRGGRAPSGGCKGWVRWRYAVLLTNQQNRPSPRNFGLQPGRRN